MLVCELWARSPQYIIFLFCLQIYLFSNQFLKTKENLLFIVSFVTYDHGSYNHGLGEIFISVFEIFIFCRVRLSKSGENFEYLVVPP